jgi:hypothetical protein
LTHRLHSIADEFVYIEGDANAIIDFDDSVHRIVGFLRPSRVASETASEARAA